MTTVRIAFDAGNYLGETPSWSDRDGALWWINCEQPAELHRWRPDTGAHRTWPMPQRIGGFVQKARGGLLVALADGIYDFDPESARLSLRARAPLPAHVKLHECLCDRQGRFWVGAFDHHYPANRSARDGCYFRLDGAELTPVIEGIAVANGLAFSPDGRIMYAADTAARSVQAYTLDPDTGAIGEPRSFIALAPGDGHVDGATVDAAGGYWLAVVGAGSLRRYHPDGSLDRQIALPFSNPTKPAFGGADLRTLYVTSTKMAMATTHSGAQANGPVFALAPGETGLEDTPFAERADGD